MDPQTRAAVANRLLEAHRTGNSIAPLSDSYKGMTVEDAYAIQLLQVEAMQADGRSVRGHKVGLTNGHVQTQLGVDEPDYGHLMDDFFHLEYAPMPTSSFIQPRIEPEVAFVLRAPLSGPGVTIVQAIAAVDYLLPALEIVDSRIDDWRIKITDTIADNASSGALVLGSTPTPLANVDLRLAGCALYRNGQVAATGSGGAVIGSPINALVWLANKVGPLGITLEPGHVILSGAMTPMVTVSAGDTFTASFTGLGSATARFTTEAA
ncbi:2-keto-4-pentenoate hydratase [Mycolicibacterium sp. D5.8-2]|uniref:2-keto-4-pentenoate hydratase n=1 Tax=Mycolicibacterium sp. D5.8-2 TaxID=3085903 RepID=UPI00298CEFD0|nr:2-keto-4-pentenoate hydratase [Mycolicibacterium sp. D5.8-2]MDW5615085.1 2-keto-4-pentenoate hydratase [Mycolicibacterium sp. D5.8-2]